MASLLLQIKSFDLIGKSGKSTDNSDDDDGSRAEDGETMLAGFSKGAAGIGLVAGIITVSSMSGFSRCSGGILDADSSVRQRR